MSLERDESSKNEGPAHAEALQQTEQWLRVMIDAVKDYAIFTLDCEGRITSWNGGAHRLEGYTREEVIGRSFSLFYTPEDRAREHPREELRRAKAEGRYEEEGWRVRKDGSRFWANVVITAVFDRAGRHLGFTKVTRDFTERRKVEERLRLSEQRFRLLVDSVKDYAIFMLDPEGRIETWNSGAQKIKGYRPEEVLGKPLSIFYRPEDAAAGYPDRELEIARTEGRYEEEGWRVRKNGELFWANVILTAIYDESNKLRGFAKVTRDLTERRRMEAEAREAERKASDERARTMQAELAVKMRDDFISIAAHELRTPLAALKLKLQSAQRTLQKNEQTPTATLAERLEGAGRHVDRMGRLIERLLDVSRIVAGNFAVKREEMDLATTVRHVVSDFREHASHSGCEVVVSGDPTVIGFWERQRIEQIVINLLANAVKYGAGKPVTVHVEGNDSVARLSVSDQGIGIAPEDADRIFGRFERAVPATYGGLGLGLYITRHIIEAHGGSIRVESELGRGSTFLVELPRRRES